MHQHDDDGPDPSTFKEEEEEGGLANGRRGRGRDLALVVACDDVCDVMLELCRKSLHALVCVLWRIGSSFPLHSSLRHLST